MDSPPALRMKPLVIKKGNIRILRHNLKNDGPLTPNVLFKEDVLYDTSDMYFLKGEYQRLLLVNRLNIVSKQSRTVAKYYSKDGSVTEKTSDKVTEVIGQEQFKTILTALCSILDQDLKIRSLLALLTLKDADKKVTEPNSIKNESYKPQMKLLMDNSCQTDEMRIEKAKPRKRIRKPVTPYIVQDLPIETEKKIPFITPDLNKEKEKKKPKRLIINVRKVNEIDPETLEKETLRSETFKPYNDDQDLENNGHTLSSAQKNYVGNKLIDIHNKKNDIIGSLNILQNHNLTELNTPNTNSVANLAELVTQKHSTGSLADLGFLDDEYSNESFGKLSALSETPTDPELLTNPEFLLNNIDQRIKENITQTGFTVPGTDIVVAYKPEDMFHIASKQNLKYLDNIAKKKLLQHQLSIDYENCLNVMDEDGNMPIHLAVMNNDAELLVRLCIVLKMRGCSIDMPDDGVTALKLAVALGRGALAACLVRHGACPLRTDASHRTCIHDAAEKDPDVLRALLAACGNNARKILYENEDLWKDEMDTQTDEELAQYLFKYMCTMYNKQGYNPLMLASMLGLYENVRVLIEHSASVNDRMPTCGNTALYLAVTAACDSSAGLGNKSKIVDHFRKTIEVLLLNGADPSIDNNYGTNVHGLLQESSNHELCMLVANRRYDMMLKMKDPPLRVQSEAKIERDVAKVMLILGLDGNVRRQSLENERKKKENVKSVNMTTDKKLVIVEDVVLKPGSTASDVKNVKPKHNSRNVKVFQIQGGASKVGIEKLGNAKKNSGVKRKQSAVQNPTKQAKTNK